MSLSCRKCRGECEYFLFYINEAAKTVRLAMVMCSCFSGSGNDEVTKRPGEQIVSKDDYERWKEQWDNEKIAASRNTGEQRAA